MALANSPTDSSASSARDEKIVDEEGSVSQLPPSKDVAPIDTAAEKRLVRKLDARIIPVLFILYLVCFLDRTNIGNARVAGLEKDLKLKSYGYSLAMTLFYLCYALVEVPANMVLRKVGANIWIPCIVISFGIVSLATAFVKNQGDLIATRVFLGITEGPLMCSFVVLISRFYTRREAVLRIAIFASSATLAGALGGLLAYAFLHVHVPSPGGWRSIFFYEGLISIVVGIAAFFFVPNDPLTAKFLNNEERQLASARLLRGQAGAKVVVEATKRKLILQTFTNINVFAAALGFGLSSFCLQGFAIFAPTIIRGINPRFTTLEIQTRTIPLYVCAFIVAIAWSYASAKYDRRAYPIISVHLFAVIGYVILLGSPTRMTELRYAAMFLVAMGVFTAGAIWLSWGVANAGLDQQRAIASALIISIGTMGSIACTWSFLPKTGPRYMLGNSLNTGSVLLNMLLATALLVKNKRENSLRARGGRDYRLEGKSDEQLQELGSLHPDFRYVY